MGIWAASALVALASWIGDISVARADDWGCDSVNTNTGNGLVDDCGPQGACCDAHDDGYRVHGCDKSSWYHTMCSTVLLLCPEADACDQVNTAAAVCIATQSPGPGRCCNYFGHNVCQQPRNSDPNHYWDCATDAFCDTGSRCNVSTGVCEALCTQTVPTQCDVPYTDSCGNNYPAVGCRDGLQCVYGTCMRCDSCAAHPGQCGIFDDGCGREIACGCGAGLICDNGSCAPGCHPYSCADYGYSGVFPDGCGGEVSCYFPGSDPGSGGDPGGGAGDPGGGGDECWDCWDLGDPDSCPSECTDEEE